MRNRTGQAREILAFEFSTVRRGHDYQPYKNTVEQKGNSNFELYVQQIFDKYKNLEELECIPPGDFQCKRTRIRSLDHQQYNVTWPIIWEQKGADKGWIIQIKEDSIFIFNIV